ncbi:MAG: D-mannonate dehydratase [Mucilaginibacter sp.]|jgi:mannonate dehydratase|nr:D-mannonate dehydratase [Mucilaginibacter sp.]
MSDNRRDFIKKSAALAAALSVTGGGIAAAAPLIAEETERLENAGKISKIKIAGQITPEPTAETFSFYNQMGIDQAVLWTDNKKASADYFTTRKKLFADNGLNVYGFGNEDVHNQDKLVLNLPGRDEKIEEYKTHLRNLGKAGIGYTTYAHMGNGIWDSDTRGHARGGADARDFNVDAPHHGRWQKNIYHEPLSHGRQYTRDEIWANFKYFIQAVVRTAEENNVHIGIHPDDPPIPELAGVPRLFTSFDGYKHALDLANNSPSVGLCLCVGSWMEGGDKLGKDSVGMIDYFGKKKRIYKIHFRNIYSPLPHFVESFVDDGYTNMYTIMQALKRVEFDGVIIPDHIPKMAGGPTVGTAYTIGYMKALLNRVNAEA